MMTKMVRQNESIAKILYLSVVLCLGLRSPLNATELPARYTELLQYIVPSPDQGHTDNCLYMASVGAMEVLANRYFGIKNPGINGSYDFNERTISQGGKDEDDDLSFIEKPVLRFNNGGVRNSDLPYRSSSFWASIPSGIPRVKLPQIKTHWFLKGGDDDKSGRFDADVFSDADIIKMKEMLVRYHSPIVITARDAGYERGYGYWNTWHTVTIVGYDDDLSVDDEDPCPVVTRTMRYAGSYIRNKLQDALDKRGGCSRKGVFYVRDSEDPEKGESRVPHHVLKTYDHFRLLGNNAMMPYIPELTGEIGK